MLEPPDGFDARPVIAYLVKQAHDRDASDLHFSPLPERVEVSLRLDGVLRHQFDLQSQVYQRLTTGLKNLAKLVSYKKSTPQDGSLQVDGVEVRVATVPTVHGERMVLRILSSLGQPGALRSLGFKSTELEVMQRLVDRPQGLILATGPAGSGKTTTLLSLMKHLVQIRKERLSNDEAYRCSVVTLEDPVEYVVPGFHQTSIKDAQGMTFAQGLRSLLRQDPEMILVGEIRDPETARAVVQAGLSGHLVFSTVHARDSVGVVPRMLEMGVDGYQLAASLAGVIYQRLLRNLCEACKVQTERGYGPSGCAQCLQSGYTGRTAIPEILVADEAFGELILTKARLSQMRELAAANGTVPLWDAAAARVKEGSTSWAEVERVVGLGCREVEPAL